MDRRQPSTAPHLAEQFRAGLNEGRRRGLIGPDLTSFALLHIVTDVLMLRTIAEATLTMSPARPPVGASPAEHRRHNNDRRYP